MFLRITQEFYENADSDAERMEWDISAMLLGGVDASLDYTLRIRF